jgi:hypothetical protein
MNNVSYDYYIQKAEGECHSSIFFGLFENLKMNETHVATMSNTAEKKGGSKQESNDVNG